MVIAKNKKAYWEYTILDEYDAGIVLVGSELKPLVSGKVSLNESYCMIDNNEVFIKCKERYNVNCTKKNIKELFLHNKLEEIEKQKFFTNKKNNTQ